MKKLRTLAPLFGSLAALACGNASRLETNGRVAVQARTNLHVAAPAGGPPAVCGHFVLQPVSIDAAGHEVPAGAPVSLDSSGSAQTSAILGCIDDGNTATPNWGYEVTASGWTDCAGNALPTATPATVFANATVSCTRGKDTALNIAVDVSIPVANAAGYLDISIGVDATAVQTGCKVADLDASGALHFGQSWEGPAGAVQPSAYTGIGVQTPPASSASGPQAGALQQFSGAVGAAGVTDEYFTGVLRLPPAPQVTTVIQALTAACPAGQMNVSPHAAECFTRTDGATAQTAVQIADLIVSWPGTATVSAILTAAQTIELSTSLGDPKLGTATPATTGYAALAQLQSLSTPFPPSGIFASLLHPDELLAVLQTPAGPEVEVLTLDLATGAWSGGAPVALPSLAEQQAMGLFGKGGCLPLPAAAPAKTGLFHSAGRLTTVRDFPTATLLQSGKVLIAGGQDASAANLASAELYDPATGTFSPTGAMTDARYGQTATLLPSGLVLLTGGSAAQLPSAELYDPAAGSFTRVGNLSGSRTFHTATLLPSGRVLIAGGTPGGGAYLSSAELFDPGTGTFTATGSMATPREFPTATLLSNGLVLLAGGYDNSYQSVAELYDPATGLFTPTGSMVSARATFTATLLSSGLVLVAGGYSNAGFLNGAELYDPATGSFAATGSMGTGRTWHDATRLPSGLVLVAGGNGNGWGNLSSAELYDPASGAFTATGSLITARSDLALTTLPGGRVLVSGGYGDTGPQLGSAEIYY